MPDPQQGLERFLLLIIAHIVARSRWSKDVNIRLTDLHFASSAWMSKVVKPLLKVRNALALIDISKSSSTLTWNASSRLCFSEKSMVLVLRRSNTPFCYHGTIWRQACIVNDRLFDWFPEDSILAMDPAMDVRG